MTPPRLPGSPPTAAADEAGHGSPRRWLILAGYSLLAASTQLLWLTFAPIDTQSAAVMHVSVDTVGYLAVVFPLVYIVLALPTGRWLDSRFDQALGAGALLTAAGALLRLADPRSFGWQLAGQLVIAAGQPLVLNSITKIAAHHFAPGQRALAISVGSVALFAGILAAALTGGPLLAAGGLPLLLAVQAVTAVVAAGAVLAALRFPTAYPDDPSATVALRWLAGDRFMWLLAALVFIGMGTYNAVATWLQPILAHFGEGGTAGEMVAILTLGGIVGAAVVPSIIARADRRRDLLIAALSVSTLAFAAIVLNQAIVWIAAWLFAAGFLLLASLPVVLDWSELHAGPERQGAAVGFLLMAGNLGGLLLVLLVQRLIGNPYLALGAIAAASAVGLPLALRLPVRTKRLTGGRQ